MLYTLCGSSFNQLHVWCLQHSFVTVFIVDAFHMTSPCFSSLLNYAERMEIKLISLAVVAVVGLLHESSPVQYALI